MRTTDFLSALHKLILKHFFTHKTSEKARNTNSVVFLYFSGKSLEKYLQQTVRL